MTHVPDDSKLQPGHKPKQLHARLSPRTSFDLRAVHMGFEIDKMALGQIFLPALQFPPVSIHYTHVSYSLIIREMDNGHTHSIT
jgi:maltodextrin utilization protein YvdJ